ncbi:WD40 repeat-like protein [Multifurca ochricompacta]|uniref:WD repeat-containing protein JIP5 n=1 Tax=Multifurca ochricompacta TaxID=376703 RepID=A0AAD4M308_9AGAM|nr:WD40 repeat-like protein [Multifurca ochricompacta]
MPNIPVNSQIFDLAFHPNSNVVYTGLLNGKVKAFTYDDNGVHSTAFDLRISKLSCRGLAINPDGSSLYAVGKNRTLHVIDTTTATVSETRQCVHDAPINRVAHPTPRLLATGDDDGMIKLWDPRKQDAIRRYTQHFDFISDFMCGDGTLSVMDVRSTKSEPFAHSENQEDELLSIVPFKGGTKIAVGTQLGMISIFNRNKGWGDCVDRVPGHPHSIDALCTLPSAYPSSHNTILTGSSDGLLRVIELLPTRLVGVIADHGDFPIERIAIDRAGEGRWVGSVGHDEVLRMTDLREVFEDEGGGQRQDASVDEEVEVTPLPLKKSWAAEGDEQEPASARKEDEESGNVSDAPKPKRRKKEKGDLKGRPHKRGRNQVDASPSFFSDL